MLEYDYIITVVVKRRWEILKNIFGISFLLKCVIYVTFYTGSNQSDKNHTTCCLYHFDNNSALNYLVLNVFILC